MIYNFSSLLNTQQAALLTSYFSKITDSHIKLFSTEAPQIDLAKQKAALANLTRRLFDKIDMENVQEGKTYSFSKETSAISAQFTKEGKLASLSAHYEIPYDDTVSWQRELRISNVKINALGSFALSIAGLSLLERVFGQISNTFAIPIALASAAAGAIKGYEKGSLCHWDVKWHDKVEGQKKERIKESRFSQNWGNWFTSTQVHSYQTQDQSKKESPKK